MPSRRRCGAGPRQQAARGCDWPHHGLNGGDGGVGACSGEGARRWPAAALTAARGTTAWRKNVGKQAHVRATLGAKEASWGFVRRRAQAASSSTTSGDDGGGRLGVARRERGGLLYAAQRIRG
jgi:hypothetical protein